MKLHYIQLVVIGKGFGDMSDFVPSSVIKMLQEILDNAVGG